MDVVVNSRHCELTDRFRSHVEEKLARLEKHDHRIIRVQVEVAEERNPRQADRSVKVELTAFSKGPVVRAEAAADHKMAALDLAIDKMAAQLRRAADRRRVHRGRHAPVSVGRVLADLPEDGAVAGRGAGRRRRRAPGRSDHGRGRRAPGGAREAAPGRAHDAGPGALRDGAGRPRLLPVPRPGVRAAQRGLPPARLRLRRHRHRIDVDA